MLLALVLYNSNMLDVGTGVNGAVCTCLFMIAKILQCHDMLKMPSETALVEILFMQIDTIQSHFSFGGIKKNPFLRGVGCERIVFLFEVYPRYMYVYFLYVSMFVHRILEDSNPNSFLSGSFVAIFNYNILYWNWVIFLFILIIGNKFAFIPLILAVELY